MKQELCRENTTLVDDCLSKVGCMMSVMTHLDFCRVLPHYLFTESGTPTRVGCPTKYNTQRLADSASCHCLWEIGGETKRFTFRSTQSLGAILKSETGALL